MSMSGTSMSAPVVTGTVALMMQANPRLSPNLVKAILQYTAEHKPQYNDLTQGAGFLNARGAVQLARVLGSSGGSGRTSISDPTLWNKHINWGNHRIGGGVLRAGANAWSADVTWGATATDDGDTIVWGTLCGDKRCDGPVWGSTEEDTIVWGTTTEDNIVWGTSDEDNIVWGTACGGADCESVTWGAGCDSAGCSAAAWGTSSVEGNIVWGTGADDEDNIVWGTAADITDVSWSAPPAEPSTSESRMRLRRSPLSTAA
jgi:hypothetical protein